MSTTGLFVELVVIGSGTAAWLYLLGASLVGLELLATKDLSSVLLIPALAVVYVLGIVTDRIADWAFSRWDNSIRIRILDSIPKYRQARLLLYSLANERLCKLFDYNKSRIRIARAWTLNLLLCAITAPTFVCLRCDSLQPTGKTVYSVTAFFLLTAAAVLTTWAWRILVVNDYSRLKEAAEYLQQ